MSSHKLVKTAPAARDLRSILRYTRERWGTAQRARYAARLTEAMDRLVQYPDIGEIREERESRFPIRAYMVESHVIYYRVTPEAIVIMRVLHARMDATSLLDL